MVEENDEPEGIEPESAEAPIRRRRSERQLQSEASDKPLRESEPDFDPTSQGDESGEVL